MSESLTIGKLAEALAKAQAQMGPAIKGAKNPFFKSSYAKLEDVIEALRIPLSDNGLSYVQPLQEEGEHTFLVTKLMHSSGEWIDGRLKLIPTKKDMQGLAGAITYAKRYSLSAMVGLAEEDDDGGAASTPPISPKTGEFKNTPTIIPKIDIQAPSPSFEERRNKITEIQEHLGWTNPEVSAQIKKINPSAMLNTLTTDEYKLLLKVMEDLLLGRLK